MKYIALSFDDARIDTYLIAKPIIEKYNLTATVNVISDFVLNPDHFSFVSAKKSMTPEMLVQWQEWGGEIACHGSTHINTSQDILKNIQELKAMGVNVESIGFASPESWLTTNNLKQSGIKELVDNGILKYLRSGIQIRREGLWYVFLNVIEMITHSPYLYYFLNKRCIFKYKQKPELLLASAIKDYTSVNQIKRIIARMKDNDALVIMLHSILGEKDTGYGLDHYYWDLNRFDELCRFLSCDSNITVLRTSDLIA